MNLRPSQSGSAVLIGIVLAFLLAAAMWVGAYFLIAAAWKALGG